MNEFILLHLTIIHKTSNYYPQNKQQYWRFKCLMIFFFFVKNTEKYQTHFNF